MDNRGQLHFNDSEERREDSDIFFMSVAYNSPRKYGNSLILLVKGIRVTDKANAILKSVPKGAGM